MGAIGASVFFSLPLGWIPNRLTLGLEFTCLFATLVVNLALWSLYNRPLFTITATALITLISVYAFLHLMLILEAE